MDPFHTPAAGRWLRWGLLLIVFALVGCAGGHRADLADLYDEAASRPKQHPVIVIPGAFGSRLDDTTTGSNIWPDSMWSPWWGSVPSDLALPPEYRPGKGPPDSLRPGRLQDNGVNQHFYENLVSTLTELGGYECRYPDELSPGTDCVLFSWDWRRDPVSVARRLDRLIEHLHDVRANRTGRVDLLAHSAGGLIARYYLRYGGRDVLEDLPDTAPMRGTRRVRKTLLIAPPNFGLVQAIHRAVNGQPLGFTTIHPETFLLIPGLYPLLPRPGTTWAIDVRGRALSLDLYDTATWKHHRWALYDPAVRRRIRDRFRQPRHARAYRKRLEAFMAAHLRRTRRFHRSLDRPTGLGSTEVTVFGSSCYPTPSRALIERVEGRHRIRLQPRRVTRGVEGVDYRERMLKPGDGSVTRRSLLGLPGHATPGTASPVEDSVFICRHHASYTSSPTFQNNLIDRLLEP